ncbi:hypothetical protein SDC9_191183 [bioreactor metagenome]|uniref:Uncharacterized protein n=1 Tax=bioreactor metagenome TaxID=1076179 RepID=A0A645I867_9ZZZZ
MRQVVARLARVKRELEHLHAGETALLEQRANLVRQEAEIFRDDLKRGERSLELVYEVAARPLDPLSVPCGFGVCRDAPIGGEPTEVIDPHTVKQRAGGAHASHPP